MSDDQDSEDVFEQLLALPLGETAAQFAVTLLNKVLPLNSSN